MNRYKIKIVKKYDFNLNGNSKDEIEDKIKTIMDNNMLKLQDIYNESKTLVSIKKIEKERFTGEKNC